MGNIVIETDTGAVTVNWAVPLIEDRIAVMVTALAASVTPVASP